VEDLAENNKLLNIENIEVPTNEFRKSIKEAEEEPS